VFAKKVFKMGHRGQERLVRCEKCGREVRRDKALFIEKAVFTNPLERKDVYSETYNRVLTREVSYCISCGKHARLFEKKKKMMQRQRERERFGRFAKHGPYYRGKREYSYSSSTTQSKPASQPQQPPSSSASSSSAQAAEGQPA